MGLFLEINLDLEKLGKSYAERNTRLCTIITTIAEGSSSSADSDTLGDAYEYVINQFASDFSKKAGGSHTPHQISSIVSGIVTLDSQ